MEDVTGKRLTWLGLAIASAGLALGFMPRSTGPVSCGSAFGGGGNAGARDFASTLAGWPGEPSNFVALCAYSLQPWRIAAVVLIVLGLAVAVAVRLQRHPEKSQPREPSAT